MSKNKYIEQINELGFDNYSNLDSMIHKVNGAALQSKSKSIRSFTVVASIFGVLTLFAFLLAEGPSKLSVIPTDKIGAPATTTHNIAQESTSSTQAQSQMGNSTFSANSVTQPTEEVSQPTSAVQNSEEIDGTNELYTFNLISTTPRDAATLIPPGGSVKKEISFAEYKDILGFNPLPQYIPSDLSVSYGTNDADKKVITFLADGMLAPNSLGSWTCQFDNPHSFAGLQIEISCGEGVKDYVVNGKLERSKILDQAILCKAINGDDVLLTADFKFCEYNIFISARNIKQEDFIEMLQSYNK